MAQPFTLAELAAQTLDLDQAGRHDLLHLFGQHMALHLHLAEHCAQHAGEVGNARRQGQVDQFDPWRHGQTGIADH
ncbi:hypothetical protein D3C75_1341540 [compost metagenome]